MDLHLSSNVDFQSYIIQIIYYCRLSVNTRKTCVVGLYSLSQLIIDHFVDNNKKSISYV